MTTDPALTTAVAVQSAPLMRQISTWVTYYIPGPHNGNAANITIPAMAISGTIVAPGQTFSFWKSVGEVSLAKGYKLGGAIIGGHSVEGKTIGGGICSTSTTLFNAALRAGFQMGARKNHYYYITRYPKGLDATVFISGSTQDMTWTNDSPYPVLIKATARPGVVRFTLYSVPTGRYVTISRPIVKNYQPSTTIIQKTTTLRHGVRQQVEYEAAGFDAWVTVTVHDKTGKVLGARTYYSHYSRVVGVILVGQ
jgi:vancomycin resistance protein YoaR